MARKNTLALIACSASKGSNEAPAPARFVYKGECFNKAKALVERRRLPWFILSAKYGLIKPEEKITTYDLTLADLNKRDRNLWGELAAATLSARCWELVYFPEQTTIEIFAGNRYCDPLVSRLEAAGFEIKRPLEGLGIGEQLQHLNRLIALAEATHG